MATDLRIDAENKPGALASIAKALGDAGVNIEGYCGVGNGGHGVIHLLVDDAAGARRALEGGSHPVAAEREALLIERGEDRPGYLAEIAVEARRCRHQRRRRLRRHRHPPRLRRRRPRPRQRPPRLTVFANSWSRVTRFVVTLREEFAKRPFC